MSGHLLVSSVFLSTRFNAGTDKDVSSHSVPREIADSIPMNT